MHNYDHVNMVCDKQIHGISYTYINTQGNTTNLNNSSFLDKEKRAAQVGLEPTTHCLLGRCSTSELPRQLNGWVGIKTIQRLHV